MHNPHVIRLKTRLPGDLRYAIAAGVSRGSRTLACNRVRHTLPALRSRGYGGLVTTSGRPGQAEAQAVAFTGYATEYFGIWITNLVLSVATLGVFSCWAKVRRVRYFRANTIILGDRLDYHTTGRMMLKGRLIVQGIPTATPALGAYGPITRFTLAASLAPLHPRRLNRDIRFDAGMMSRGNGRPDRSGTCRQAVRVPAVRPPASLSPLGLLRPPASGAWRHSSPTMCDWGGPASGREHLSVPTTAPCSRRSCTHRRRSPPLPR